MEVSDKKMQEIGRRVLLARMRILINNGFYGLLLMHMKISLGDEYDTAWTNSIDRIWFNPEFVDQISDRELEFVLMHEIMHAALHHSMRVGNRDAEIFNIAADLVVNSNIYHSNSDDDSSISLAGFGGVQPHLAPDGKEGYEYTVEELYRMLFSSQPKKNSNKKRGWDVHIFSVADDDDGETIANKLMWEGYIRQAAEAISGRDPKKQRGLLPAFAERYVNELKKPQVDWRQILNEFIQDEINDYSFMPPDRRMDDCPFFLPDFNERDQKPGKILFAVDTSGSMSAMEITACYSEIKGAIDQFSGKLEGLLCFFDAALTPPVPFSDVDELLSIIPQGGGGTSFGVVFDYLATLDEDDMPQNIVILTDGCAPFPEKERALGIPVLWVIDNEKTQVPWGKVARISVE